MIDRGDMINLKARLGAELYKLERSIPELEKIARKTPAKTMHDEWNKIHLAEIQLEKALLRLPLLQKEYKEATDLLEERFPRK